ncbi:DNA-directed RNA polymerase II subunit RPB7 [Cucumispora dikerogammari]|nr:DNA-directed RNA polymerase II subunit RPB7 [Cucumispora dikerogammari]
MFTLKLLKSNLSLPPSLYSADIKTHLLNLLHNLPIITHTGILLCVKEIKSINQFPVNITGEASFSVEYIGLVLELRVGEVVDLEVVEVNNSGMFLSLSDKCENFSVFVSSMQMGNVGNNNKIQRVRILGWRVEDNKKVVGVGTIRGEYLGGVM